MQQRLYTAGQNTNYNLGILAPYQSPVYPFTRVQQRPLLGDKTHNYGPEYGNTGDPLVIWKLSISNTHMLWTSNEEIAGLPDLGYFVWGMGNNQYYVLGGADTGILTVRRLAAGTGLQTLDVVAGYNKSFRIDTGAVYAWGFNGGGSLGIGGTTTWQTPRLVSGSMPQVNNIVGDSSCTWFLCENGQVFACGNNLVSKLGISGGVNHMVPTGLSFSGMAPGDKVIGVAACVGAGHAWTASGALYSWGQNSWRTVGIGGVGQYVLPVRVCASGVTWVSTSQYHALMVSGDRLFACGRDLTTGRLGMDGPSADVLTWTPVSGELGVSGVKQAACEGMGSYAITTEGRLYAWGETAYTSGVLRPSGILPNSPYFADRFIEQVYSQYRRQTVIEVYNAADTQTSGILTGHSAVSGYVAVLGAGHVPRDSQIPGAIVGHIPVTRQTIARLVGHGFRAGNILAWMDTYGRSEVSLDLSFAGHLSAEADSWSSLLGHGLSTDTLSVVLLGPLWQSTSVGVVIPGYIPRPGGACPTLDLTASIQIGADLIGIYQSRIDALINQLGKNVYLEFDPVGRPCNNCIADGTRGRSTGMYRPGGPLPFPRGQKCPQCKGSGIISTPETRCIKCLIKWNPRDHRDHGVAVADSKAIIRTKSFLSDAPLIRRASTAIMNVGASDIIRLRVRRLRGPIPVGLRQARYCITYWELVETD